MINRLHHDRRRSKSIENKHNVKRFAQAPGVAQTIHWARTTKMGFGSKDVIDALVDSELSIEEGLIDGVFAKLGDEDEEGNLITWGQATHVGCGWIQFPHIDNEQSNAVLEYEPTEGSGWTEESYTPEKQEELFENFMVCNYAIGVPSKTTCSKDNSFKIKSSSVHKQFIKYYHASAGVISDVKKCLQAVRCKRQNKKIKNVKLIEGRGESNSCGNDVESCLAGKSGLQFVKPSRLRDVARATDYVGVVDLEASKCKIDTILCRSLNLYFTFLLVLIISPFYRRSLNNYQGEYYIF